MDESVTSSSALSPPTLIIKLKREMDCNTLEQKMDILTHEPQEAYNALEPERDFILKLELLPVLWNTKNAYYTNKFKRRKALEELLPILKKIKPLATITDVKKKINSLRSNYRRELRKVYASEKEGEIYTPKIWYFPYLSFLNNLERFQIHRVGTPMKQKLSDELNNQEFDDNPQAETFSSVLVPALPSQMNVSNTIIDSTSRIYQQDTSDFSKPMTLDTNKSSYPSQIIHTPIILDWAETLDRLDSMQRIYAKKAINDVLFEAELGNLHRNSVRINEDDSRYPSKSFLTHSSPHSQPPTTP